MRRGRLRGMEGDGGVGEAEFAVGEVEFDFGGFGDFGADEMGELGGGGFKFSIEEVGAGEPIGG